MSNGHNNVSTEIDRVLDSSNGRLFQVRSVIQLFDGSQRPFLETGIPIKNSDGKTIGFASVFSEGKCWVAELAFDYSTPERLAIETKSERLFAHLNHDETGIHSLEISRKQPTDKRLEPLGAAQL